jgi:uncharacterized protein (TIGR01777 family)
VKIAVTGASGLIGSHLVVRLRERGHDVLTLVRRPVRQPGEVFWDPAEGLLNVKDLEGVDAAVHLAGAGIGDKRWDDAYKKTVLESRVSSTRLLARVLTELDAKPAVLLSGSAIGYYGDAGEVELDERSPAGTGFLADVCHAWENAASVAHDAGIRTVHLRTGLVLSGAGGMLKQQLLLYKVGGGGPLGSGRQWWSWISLADELGAIEHLLTADIAGPVNLTAPAPVRQREFATELGRALHRPAFLPTPAFALKLALGEFAEAGVLASQKVLPHVLENSGYVFVDRSLTDGLRSALS